MKIPLICFFAISVIMAIHGVGAKRGIPISIKKAPFFVSITHNNEHVCGGAFISPKHILTAAHCIMENAKDYIPGLSVMSRVTKYYRRGIVHWIQAVIHPVEFQSARPKQDIAVLVLSDSFVENSRQKAIPLPNQDPMEAQPAKLYAYDMNLLAGARNGHLSETEFFVYSNPKICLKLTSSNVFCALNHAKDKVNPSDLGGPLLQNGAIIGIASWVDHNEDDGVTYYENIRRYSTFINRAMKCMDSSCKVRDAVVHPYQPGMVYY